MEETDLTQIESAGLSERLLREILRTPPLKEAIVLLMKDIDPDAAPGLVKAVLWEETGVSLSFFGALPDIINWLLAFLLELGRQLNNIPDQLLSELLGKVGSGIDLQRLEQYPQVYGRLAKRLLIGEAGTVEDAQALTAQVLNAVLAAADRLTSRMDEDREETARFIAGSLDDLDTVSLGRILNRFVGLCNAVRRSRRVPIKDRMDAMLSQMEAGEFLSMLGGLLRSCVSTGWSILSWVIRSLVRSK